MVQALNYTQQQYYQQQPGQEVRLAALAAINSQISVVPIAPDGTKAPPRGFGWKWLQKTLPNAFIVNRWFSDFPGAGLAVLGGKVSGNLEILDFDKADEWSRFCKAARQVPGLYALITRIAGGYLERSPKGIHMLYRCEEPVEGNLKLARAYKVDGQGQPVIRKLENGRDQQEIQVLIETRGEGGYVIVAPSAGRVHPSGRPYSRISGNFDRILTITAQQRQELLELARSLDRLPKEERPTKKLDRHFETVHGAGGRPGDDYNARASWDDVLRPFGWQLLRRRGQTEYWQRPGKGRSEGWSATINWQGRDMLRVFTSSTVFEEKAYTKFSAYAVLNHNGNFSAAAAELAGKGYGTPRETHDDPDPATPEDDTTPPKDTTKGRRRKTRHVELEDTTEQEKEPNLEIEDAQLALAQSSSARFFSSNKEKGKTVFLNPKLNVHEVLLVASQPGTGKGYAFNEEASREVKRNPKHTTAWFTPRLNMFADQDRPTDLWKLIEGRHAAKDVQGTPADFDSPNAIEGSGNCTIEGEAYHQAMAAKGWERESHKYCQMTCPAQDNCQEFGYLSKLKKDGRNAVMSFQHLFTTTPKNFRFMTIDEISYHSFVDVKEITVQDFAQARQYIWNTPMQYIMRAINELMVKPPADRPRLSGTELYRELDRISREVNGGRDLLGLLEGAEAAGNCFSGELWELMAERSADAANRLPPNIWHVEGAEPGAGGIYDILADEARSSLEGLPLPFISRIELIKKDDKPAVLVIFRRNYLPHSIALNKPISVLDATGDGELTRLLLSSYANLQLDKDLKKKKPVWRLIKPVVRTVNLKVEMPECVTVIQDTSANFSKTALLRSLEKDPQKKYWSGYIEAICKYLLPDGKRTLLVCSSLVEKQLGQALLEQGIDEAHGYFYAIKHYGELRGTNAYKDFDRLIEAGMYMPDPEAVIAAGRALYGGDGDELDISMERSARQYDYQRREEGKLTLMGAEDDVLVFKDERLQRLLEVDREDEHLQVAHRIRPLQATTTKEIVLLFAIPVRGLAVDQVISEGHKLNGRTKRVMDKGIEFGKSVLDRQPGEGGCYFTAYQMQEATGLALGTIYKYWKEMLAQSGFESQVVHCKAPLAGGRGGTKKVLRELFMAAPIGTSRIIINNLIIFGEVPNLLPKGWEMITDAEEIPVDAPPLEQPLIESETKIRADLQGQMGVFLGVLKSLEQGYQACLERCGKYTQEAALLRERYIIVLDQVNALVRKHASRPRQEVA